MYTLEKHLRFGCRTLALVSLALSAPAAAEGAEAVKGVEHRLGGSDHS